MIKRKNRTIRVNPLLNKSHPRQSASTGVAALPLVLMLGGLVAEITISVMLSSYLLANSQFGLGSANEAFLAARIGIQDALIKIVRDKSFSSSLYTLAVGNNSVEVTVCRDTCAGAGKTQILSVGKAKLRNKKLEAVAFVDSLTGEVILESLREVEL